MSFAHRGAKGETVGVSLRLRYEPRRGFEPPTYCLQNNCSTIELSRLMSRHRDSNSGPLPYHGSALPAELCRQIKDFAFLLLKQRLAIISIQN